MVGYVWRLVIDNGLNTLKTMHHKHMYIYSLGPHSEHQNNPFQSKWSKHFHPQETTSSDVKLVLIRYNFQKLDPMQ